MSSALPFFAAGKTDRGQVRESNEDGFVCDRESALYAVADGLGGLDAGEVASSVALAELRREIGRLAPGSAPDWQAVFTRINGVVLQAGRLVGVGRGVGTTLTAVRATPGKLHVGHVGDSGLYVLSAPGRFVRVTRDQTLAQDFLDKHGPGLADTLPPKYHHTLTQCLGQPVEPVVEVLTLDVRPGMRVLLYTDGVTKTMLPEELAARVSSAATPETLVESIVSTANERGGPDNVTAVALFY